MTKVLGVRVDQILGGVVLIVLPGAVLAGLAHVWQKPRRPR